MANDIERLRKPPSWSELWHDICKTSNNQRSKRMTTMTMRCAVDHFLRNGFLKLQYRLRRLGFPRSAVVKGLSVSEQVLKGLRILG